MRIPTYDQPTVAPQAAPEVRMPYASPRAFGGALGEGLQNLGGERKFEPARPSISPRVELRWPDPGRTSGRVTYAGPGSSLWTPAMRRNQ
jgi:hypothetical protein